MGVPVGPVGVGAGEPGRSVIEKNRESGSTDKSSRSLLGDACAHERTL